MTEEDAITEMERRSEAQTKRLRQLLLEEGRPDLVAELDEKLRNVRLGIEGAQNVWHSISPKQRTVMQLLGEHRLLERTGKDRSTYDIVGDGGRMLRVCQRSTVRKLIAHRLFAWGGPENDPERSVVMTERGRFVLAKGVGAASG